MNFSFDIWKQLDGMKLQPHVRANRNKKFIFVKALNLGVRNFVKQIFKTA